MVPLHPSSVDHARQMLKESTGKGLSLVVQIEAIHEGTTRNKIAYTAKGLRGNQGLNSGAYSWTKPYPRPILTHHNTSGEPIGRVVNAKFVQAGPKSGRPGLILDAEIVDPTAIEKVLDGRYMTGSIGATTDTLTCSICSKNLLAEEGGPWWHEHQKGELVDGKEVIYTAGDLWFDEYSFVNVPADPDSQAIGMQVQQMAEAFLVGEGKRWNLSKEWALAESVEDTPSPEAPAQDSELPESTEVTELKATISQLEAALVTATDETENARVQAEALQHQITELQADATAKAEQIQALEGRLSTAEFNQAMYQSESQTMMQENALLHGLVHQSMAERVVDLKMALGKVTNADRNEEIQGHAARTHESLADSLTDLLKEQASIQIVRTIEIKREGLGNPEEHAPIGLTRTDPPTDMVKKIRQALKTKPVRR